MAKGRTEPRFRTEAALCMEFVAAARHRGWRASPETSGWDILLARPDGVQVGVQAKLKANLHVLAQAMAPERRMAGPDHHAVLVPDAYGQEQGFSRVAAGLGITVICPHDPWMGYGDRPALSWDRAFAKLERQLAALPRWEHARPAWVPDVDVLIPAGSSGPEKVTAWKLGAVRLAMLLREQGYLDESDFKAHQCDRRWWVDAGVVRGVKRDGAWRWERPEGAGDDDQGPAMMPDRRWPEVTAALQRGQR